MRRVLCSPPSPLRERRPDPPRARRRTVQAQPSGERSRPRLREALNETTYETWFASARAGELAGDTFSLVVPNDFTREWIEGHFLGFVKAAARDTLGRDMRVTLAVGEAAALPASRPTGQASGPGVGADAEYTFDTYVVGSSNRFAHAAALAVAEAPAQAYNPLFVYGGAGLGKTHLLRRSATAWSRTTRTWTSLRDVRDVHERLHQRPPGQAHRGFQVALSHLRHAHDRRHPVLRRQGGGSRRSSSTPSTPSTKRASSVIILRPAPKSIAALEDRLRLGSRGPDRRRAAAGLRDAHRDPAQEGPTGSASPFPTT